MKYARACITARGRSATEISYATSPQSLCQNMQVLVLKKAGTHFLLTSDAHLSFCTSLIQVTRGKANVCASEPKWLGTAGRQQHLFCQQCCQHISVATTSLSPLSLCFWVMLSWAQMWLRVRTINDGMFVQQQVTGAKLCTHWGRTSPGFWKFATSSYKLPVTRRYRATDYMPWRYNIDSAYFCHHWVYKENRKNLGVCF